MAGEEDFLGPEEEDLVEAARRIRLGGLEMGILYDGNRKTRLCMTMEEHLHGKCHGNGV